MADRNPLRPRGGPGWATIAVRDRPPGRGRERARASWPRHDFADIPLDGDWLITVTLLADVVAELGDAERRGLLYELLLALPRRQRGDRPGRGVPGLDRALPGAAGRDDGRARRWPLEHLRAGDRAPTRRCGPRCMLAHAQLDYAARSTPSATAAARGAGRAAAATAAAGWSCPLVARRAERSGRRLRADDRLLASRFVAGATLPRPWPRPW